MSNDEMKSNIQADISNITNTITEETKTPLDVQKEGISTIQPPENSLATLLEHIESLKKSNLQMSDTLKIIEDRNMEKFHEVVGSKIEPWVKSLNIPDDQQKSFLKGIEIACEQGHKKGIVDFAVNPAFSIACAAAEAHGNAIQSAEDLRLQLIAANESAKKMQENEAKKFDNTRQNQNNILYAAVSNNNVIEPNNNNKRKVDDIYKTEMKLDTGDFTSTCWSTVYDTMRVT